MARQFGPFPRAQLARNLAAQSIDMLMHLLQLALRLLVVAGRGLQMLDLFLDALQFGLGFRSSFHIGIVCTCWHD